MNCKYEPQWFEKILVSRYVSHNYRGPEITKIDVLHRRNTPGEYRLAQRKWLDQHRIHKHNANRIKVIEFGCGSWE